MDGLIQQEDLFSALGDLADPTRCRALRLLERQELSVGDLCSILQLPQSTVSRHLKVLADGGWVASRPDGTRRLYRRDEAAPAASLSDLWRVLRGHLEDQPASREDDERLISVLARRRSRSQAFFDHEASAWDERRDELFGQHFYLFALMGLGPQDRRVGDLGCGSGPVTEALAPFVREIVAIDGSASMVDLARQRLARFSNVDVRQGELEALPLPDADLDAATLCLVLHHLSHPERVIAEVARVLRPGGTLLIVDMLPHDREEYRQDMGHVWLGFEEATLRGYLADSFDAPRWVRLPARPRAKGPGLFAAVAVRNDRPIDPSRLESSTVYETSAAPGREGV